MSRPTVRSIGTLMSLAGIARSSPTERSPNDDRSFVAGLSPLPQPAIAANAVEHTSVRIMSPRLLTLVGGAGGSAAGGCIPFSHPQNASKCPIEALLDFQRNLSTELLPESFPLKREVREVSAKSRFYDHERTMISLARA